jgi:hypothetical protein
MEECTNLVKEVALIQDNGGLRVKGTLKCKTAGGVFFYLIKTSPSLSKHIKDKIFRAERKYVVAKKNIATDLERLLKL